MAPQGWSVAGGRSSRNVRAPAQYGLAQDVTALLIRLLCCCFVIEAAEPRLGAERAPIDAEARRCAALIALFDDIVTSRFDLGLLAVEDYELAEAETWREQAGTDCAAGKYDFGIAAIESAFRRIRVAPGLAGDASGQIAALIDVRRAGVRLIAPSHCVLACIAQL